MVGGAGRVYLMFKQTGGRQKKEGKEAAEGKACVPADVCEEDRFSQPIGEVGMLHMSWRSTGAISLVCERINT